MKLLYKTKKWDKKVKEWKKVEADVIKKRGMGIEEGNLEYKMHSYLNPSPEPKIGSPRIGDEGSFWYLIGDEYAALSRKNYALDMDTVDCIGHMYLSILAMAKSYELWSSGVEITNCAILQHFQKMEDMEKICFSAIAVNEFPIFEKYAAGDARIIAAMFHEDYDRVRELICNLPDTQEMYQKNRYYMSYYYGADFLKDLYLSILEQDGKLFNKALAERIKNVRGGYVMPIDVVSIAMIKFARKRGLDYNFDVIEIPKFFLENDMKIDKEKYRLPDLDNAVVI